MNKNDQQLLKTTVPSKEQTLQTVQCGHWCQLDYELRKHATRSHEPGAMHLRGNPNDQGTRSLLAAKLVGKVPMKRFAVRISFKRWTSTHTSTPAESTDWFHRGFRWPTRLERSVRLRYAGAISCGYWSTPLSIPSIASIKSCERCFSPYRSEWANIALTPYTLSHNNSTVGSVEVNRNWFEMISFPKCLWIVIV